MVALPLPPDPSPILPPIEPFPAEETSPLIELVDDSWERETTAVKLNIPVTIAELHKSVSRGESYAQAAEMLLNEVTENSPAGPSRRARRIVDHLISAREANLRALELIEALTAELAKML